MTRHAQAAANMKKQLTKAFPGVKFSAKSKSYSMGDHVNVHWTLGPTKKEVDDIIHEYERGYFNGMEDIYEYDNNPNKEAFRKAYGSTKYAFSNREIPDYVYEVIIRALCEAQHEEYKKDYYQINLMNERATTWVHRIMEKASFPPNAVITGLSRTETTCGQWEDFFKVEYKEA